MINLHLLRIWPVVYWWQNLHKCMCLLDVMCGYCSKKLYKLREKEMVIISDKSVTWRTLTLLIFQLSKWVGIFFLRFFPVIMLHIEKIKLTFHYYSSYGSREKLEKIYIIYHQQTNIWNELKTMTKTKENKQKKHHQALTKYSSRTQI